MAMPRSGIEFEKESLRYLLPLRSGTPGAVLLAVVSLPMPLSLYVPSSLGPLPRGCGREVTYTTSAATLAAANTVSSSAADVDLRVSVLDNLIPPMNVFIVLLHRV
jgi:hypothetical protein